MADHPSCPLCLSPCASHFELAHGRNYLQCSICELVFMAPADRPSAEDALAHYRTHQNDPTDARYRLFLSRAADPLIARLRAGASGLDYGSGPGPTLSLMLEEAGFRVALYDPLFAPDEDALKKRYDFITCTETAEHFLEPGREFERLNSLLLPDGLLVVMTELLTPARKLSEWRYARDPTHVCFYSQATLSWLARVLSWEVEYASPATGVCLFRTAAVTASRLRGRLR